MQGRVPQLLRGQIRFGVCHLRALWRRAVGQAEVLKMKSWRTVVPGSPQSTAHQKRRPNCCIADGTQGARGRGAAPQLPYPTTPSGTTSQGPCFSNRTSQEPEVRRAVPSQLLRATRDPAEPGREPCPTPPTPPTPSSPATQDALVPGVRNPGGSVPEDAGPRALPTCLPLRRRLMFRLASHPAPPASPALSPRRPHSELRAAGTAPPPAGLAAGVANRKTQPTTWRHWRRCL